MAILYARLQYNYFGILTGYNEMRIYKTEKQFSEMEKWSKEQCNRLEVFMFHCRRSFKYMTPDLLIAEDLVNKCLSDTDFEIKLNHNCSIKALVDAILQRVRYVPSIQNLINTSMNAERALLLQNVKRELKGKLIRSYYYLYVLLKNNARYLICEAVIITGHMQLLSKPNETLNEEQLNLKEVLELCRRAPKEFQCTVIYHLCDANIHSKSKDVQFFWKFLHLQIYTQLFKPYQIQAHQHAANGVEGLINSISISDEAMILTIFCIKLTDMLKELDRLLVNEVARSMNDTEDMSGRKTKALRKTTSRSSNELGRHKSTYDMFCQKVYTCRIKEVDNGRVLDAPISDPGKWYHEIAFAMQNQREAS